MPLTLLDRCLCTLIALIVFFAPYHPQWRQWWWYDADSPWQLWRWLTAHLSHWSWSHLLQNVLALMLYRLLFESYINGLPAYLTVKSLQRLFGIMIVVNVPYLAFFYQYDFYMGFSSLLYGVYAYSAVRCWSGNKGLFSLILLILCWQILPRGTPPLVIESLTLNVAQDMHLLAVGIAVLLAYFDRLYALRA
jgi:membrane associated rhomboid family serine protease